MSIISWDPFNEIKDIQDSINKLFDDNIIKKRSRSSEEAYWLPVVDIAETKDSYKIEAELPGIPKKDIDISVSGNLLTIKGEKQQEKEDKDKNYYRKERISGIFQRQLVLPQDVQADKIKANYKDGLLEITIPKVEEKKSKKIIVE